MKRLYASLIALVALAVLPVSALAGGVPWGEPINTPDRFIVLSSYNNQAVFDAETGLVWEQSPLSPNPAVGETGVRTWLNAQIHCNQRTVGNRNGWRLPTIQELASLVDPNNVDPGKPKLPPGHPFVGVLLSFYWSATTFAADASRAWGVVFGLGFVGASSKSDTLFVWCVRGGQGVDPQ